jgi:hypothetical protein
MYRKNALAGEALATNSYAAILREISRKQCFAWGGAGELASLLSKGLAGKHT